MINKNNNNLLLIIILSLSIFILIQLYPIIKFSPEPSLYTGGVNYFLSHVSNTGHLLTEKAALNLNGTIFASNVAESGRYPLLPTLYSIIGILSGITFFSWGYRIVLSFLFAIPISLVCLATYHYLEKNNNHNIDYKLSFLVLLYSLLVSPHFINQLGANGWLFMFFAIFFIFYIMKKNWKISVISILFLILLPLCYFTGSSFFLMWLSIYVLYCLCKNKFNISKISNQNVINIFILFCVIYFSYSIYIAFNRITPAFNVFHTLLFIIKGGFTGFTTSQPVVSLEYLAQTSVYNKVRILLNSIFVAMPLLLFLISRKNIPTKFSRISDLIFSGILALPCLAILTYVWLGSFGFDRVIEYASLISILSFITLLSLLKGKLKKILIICAIFAIIFSVYAYEVDESNPYRYITYSEEKSSNWFLGYVPLNSSIFTDQRLSGALVGDGFLKTTGIIETELGSNTTNVLNALYYTNNTNIHETLLKYNINSKYFYFSEEMTKEEPGIYLFNYPVKPAPTNFLLKYDTDDQINKIYTNNESVIYYINTK